MKKSRISIAMKLNAYGLPADSSFDDLLVLAENAEALGFDGVYVIDHLYTPEAQVRGLSDVMDVGRPFFPDPWSLMPAVAARTARLKIGPQVAPLMRHHPVALARASATIDWLSRGRFVLQVGTGWNAEEYRAFGLPYSESIEERYRRLAEGIQIIDRIWRATAPWSFTGEWFSIHEAPPLWPRPVSHPRPPVWIGGSGRRSRQLVAELGDGWIPAPPHYKGMTPDVYAACLEEIRRIASANGRQPHDIAAGGTFFVVLGETSESARQVAESLLRRDIWSQLTIAELADHGIAFIGSPSDVRKGMLRFADAGLENFTVAFMPIRGRADTLQQMKLFRDEVMDGLRESAA